MTSEGQVTKFSWFVYIPSATQNRKKIDVTKVYWEVENLGITNDANIKSFTSTGC